MHNDIRHRYSSDLSIHFNRDIKLAPLKWFYYSSDNDWSFQFKYVRRGHDYKTATAKCNVP